MFAKSFMYMSLLALTASAHMSNKRGEQFRCAAEEPTAEDIAAAAQLDLEVSPAPDANIAIDTVFHVVAKGKTFDEGWLSNAQLSDQLDVMNDNYAPYGISFNHIKTTRTVNANWADDGNDLAKKKALRVGDYKTLNVYFQTEVAGGALGLCYFPKNVEQGSDRFYRDGCSIYYLTVPGTNLTNYNEGKTVTHEVGHWFNLFHTFQGGCQGAGDHVADTPAQKSPTSGCPAGRDSCPGKAGKDPIHNYMDYSYDSCYNKFSAGQKKRAHNSYNKFRA